MPIEEKINPTGIPIDPDKDLLSEFQKMDQMAIELKNIESQSFYVPGLEILRGEF